MIASLVNSPRRDLWLTRAYYFLFLGGSGFIAPFLNLFYVRVGLSGTEIGIVTALTSVAALIAAPVWANASRTFRHPRALLQIALVATAIIYLILGWQSAFMWIALVAAVRGLVSASVSPMSDSLALAVTGASKTGFGSVRVWASGGWIIAVLISGWLIESAGFGVSFAGVVVVTLVGALLLAPISANYFSTPRARGRASSVRAVIQGLLANRTMLGVAAMLIAVSMGNSGVNQFETVYLSQLGAREGLLGIASTLSAVVEIPFMLLADRFVRRYSAHRLLLAAMWMTGAVRALVLFVPSIEAIFIERAVGGIAFSFYTVALTEFIGAQARTEERGTVLALYTVTLANLVAILSAPLAGIAFDTFGARWLYAIAIAGYALGWLALNFTRTKTPSNN